MLQDVDVGGEERAFLRPFGVHLEQLDSLAVASTDLVGETTAVFWPQNGHPVLGLDAEPSGVRPTDADARQDRGRAHHGATVAPLTPRPRKGTASRRRGQYRRSARTATGWRPRRELVEGAAAISYPPPVLITRNRVGCVGGERYWSRVTYLQVGGDFSSWWLWGWSTTELIVGDPLRRALMTAGPWPPYGLLIGRLSHFVEWVPHERPVALFSVRSTTFAGLSVSLRPQITLDDAKLLSTLYAMEHTHGRSTSKVLLAQLMPFSSG